MREHLQHPKETAALCNLVNNPSVHKILQVFDEAYGQLTTLAILPLYNYPITEVTAPRIYRLYRRALERLEIRTQYPLYAALGYPLSAETIGTERNCAIVINSACIEEMSDEQITALLGQQLGHIQFGHVKYMSAFKALDRIVAMMPRFVTLALDTVKYLFQDWNQYANFTSDRTAAVACGTVEPVIENLLHGMGGTHDLKNISFSASMFLEMNLPPVSELNTVGKIVFQSMTNQVEFPLGLLRIQELQRWTKSEGCRSTEPHIYYDYLAAIKIQTNLGKESLGTEICTQTIKQKMILLHVAARNGNATAMGKLGIEYLYGSRNLCQNMSYGVQMLRKAASLGDADSQIMLGRLLIDGKIVKKSMEAAQLLLEMAMSQNAPQAMKLYRSAFSLPPYIPGNILQDLVKRHAECGEGRSYHKTINEEIRAMLIERLWISHTDTITAWEEFTGGTYLVAVAPSGVYFCKSTSLPKRISWESLRIREKRLWWKYETPITRVFLDGEIVRCLDTSHFRSSIFGLIAFVQSSLK